MRYYSIVSKTRHFDRSLFAEDLTAQQKAPTSLVGTLQCAVGGVGKVNGYTCVLRGTGNCRGFFFYILSKYLFAFIY